MRSAPIIVTALFGDGDNGWLQEMRRAHYPAERNRVPAHLTLFHHLPPAIESELARRLAAAAGSRAPQARICGVMDLGAGTALRVESEALERLRAELADSFHGLLMPQDIAPWQPHITIQNKVRPGEARRLQAQLKAMFQARPLQIKALASWRYRDGPWEPIRTHAFRR
ncbi:2'-5' RNA ligase family protein [Sphingosinicella rhizophila]|uniref:2'-5' RNA ligase family protein n=1 Tax=Sphingosinicella rhizophila TaxID=3050082 RepID=A0ABU3Q2Y9_9SPHN|nr:2'-5' RNA ligase family protein [Sphingosinicella sp. GR2756]MDT9597772.1 2'-5' RNA ligase family protein [Sphingosinicella sp. GR2756]